MIILVVDGMGGGIGKAIVEALTGKDRIAGSEVIATGTNSIATATMLKGGADAGATGENAVIYNAERADYIVGTTGIIIGNSMHGEISPAIASAISCADAHKILLPVNKCNASFLGSGNDPAGALIQSVVKLISSR